MTATNKVTISIIAVTLLIIFCICYFFLYPTWLKTANIKSTIATTRDQTAAIRKQNTSLKQIASKDDLVNQLSLKADNLVPKNPKLEDFLIELEALIAQSKTPAANFQVSSLTSATQTSGGAGLSTLKNASNYQFNIDGQGSLSDILDLHNKLITMQRLAEITGISMNSGNDPSKLSFQIRGNVFSLDAQTINSAIVNHPEKILTDAQAKLSDNKSYGKEIEIQKETGFGRSNPFTSY